MFRVKSEETAVQVLGNQCLLTFRVSWGTRGTCRVLADVLQDLLETCFTRVQQLEAKWRAQNHPKWH